MTTFKIHPAIGVARVGNSEEYYLCPEEPGALPVGLSGAPVGPSELRDARHAVKRQAARFRIFRYEDAMDPGREVTLADPEIAAIEWTVHLANKKASWYEFHVHRGQNGHSPDHPLRNAHVTGPARRRLIIDPGPGRLRGPGERWDFHRDAPESPDFPGYPRSFPPRDIKPYSIQTLGSMITTAEGHLHVLGGLGCSGSEKPVPSISDYANNDGWYDDTSDGPVTATIVLRDGTRAPATPSWVLVAPPAYAPQILNLVTLHETIYDAFVRERGIRPDIYQDGLWNPEYRPSFPQDILPLLRRSIGYNWVVNIPNVPHTFGSAMLANLGDPDPRYNALRQYYVDVLRSPDDPNVFMSRRGTPLMPYLAGDGALEAPRDTMKYATLTKTQYFFFCQWAKGIFSPEPTAPPLPPGAAIDRGVLSNCVGAAMSPGIEMSWNCRRTAMYSEPFRIRHRRPIGEGPLSLGENVHEGMEPGDVSRYMAVPWQADFNECAAFGVEHFTAKGAHTNWVWWWPAQRPLMVFIDPDAADRQLVPWLGQYDDHTRDDYLKLGDKMEMVHAWKEVGFVYDVGTPAEPNFIEVARLLPRDPDAGRPRSRSPASLRRPR